MKNPEGSQARYRVNPVEWALLAGAVSAFVLTLYVSSEDLGLLTFQNKFGGVGNRVPASKWTSKAETQQSATSAFAIPLSCEPTLKLPLVVDPGHSFVRFQLHGSLCADKVDQVKISLAQAGQDISFINRPEKRFTSTLYKLDHNAHIDITVEHWAENHPVFKQNISVFAQTSDQD